MVEHLNLNKSSLTEEEDRGYFWRVIIRDLLGNTSKILKINEFLNEHYNSYSGNKIEFLDYTELRYNSIKGSLQFSLSEPNYSYGLAIKQNIERWISTKRIEIELSPNSTISADKITTKQQILIIYYLQKHNLFDINKIHGDHTKQAYLLSAILNRGNDNTYSLWNDIRRANPVRGCFTKINLKKVKEIFQEVGYTEIIEEIEKDINKLKS